MVKLSAEAFARIAKALADPQRCAILERIAKTGEHCCTELMTTCSLSQATISHHLKELTVAGLLERRRHGQFAYFRYRSDVMAAYAAELARRMGLDRRGR